MIQLSNLGFEYGAKAAVFRGLNLTIPAGRSVGILGANGVGKTTLIKLLAGLLSPTEGAVAVLERTPRRRETALYQNLYLVPEENALPAISAVAYIKRFSVFTPNSITANAPSYWPGSVSTTAKSSPRCRSGSARNSSSPLRYPPVLRCC